MASMTVFLGDPPVPGREAPAEGGEVRGAAQLVKRRPLGGV